jgi:hypothetical protein
VLEPVVASAPVAVSEGSPNEACRLAELALAQLSRNWYATGMARVRAVRESLSQWESLPDVRRLDEKLYDWNTTVNAMTALAAATSGGSSARVVMRQSAAPGRSGCRSWMSPHGPRRMKAVRMPAAITGRVVRVQVALAECLRPAGRRALFTLGSTPALLDGGHLWTHGLTEQQRYPIQHQLGFQIWDRAFAHAHGRSLLGYQPDEAERAGMAAAREKMAMQARFDDE